MTKEQRSAIRKLEQAFSKCARLGLVFNGVDGDLRVCTLEDFEAAGGVDAGTANIAGARTVYTHGSYMDSGGA